MKVARLFAYVLALALLLALALGAVLSFRPKEETEPASYWTAIANDENMEVRQRGLAIHRLFERHVEQDITLGELAAILEKPTWIKEENVFVASSEWDGKVRGHSGPMALKSAPGHTMFLILVFPNKDVERHNKEVFGLYMNISGEIYQKEFLAVIMNREESKYANRKVTAWAFGETLDEYAKRAGRQQ